MLLQWTDRGHLSGITFGLITCKQLLYVHWTLLKDVLLRIKKNVYSRYDIVSL